MPVICLNCLKPPFTIISKVLNRNKIVNSLKGENLSVWYLQGNGLRTVFTLLSISTILSEGLGVVKEGKSENYP